jgi:hypothetical protein
MGEIVVKHFRRSSVSSDEKELITEIVIADSDTGQFLQRLEESRLTRPCFQTIDMRGRVAGECRPYAFNDRIHYLDDISFQMFEQGLLENKGVYTVGTFEAIVGGAHTIKAQQDARDRARRRQEEIEQRRLERARAAALERGALQSSDDEAGIGELAALPDNPEVLPLGYFRKRSHARLQYACAVTVQRGNIKSSGVTRDLSVCGAQVRIRGLTAFRSEDEVKLSFEGLQDEARRVNVTRIPYQVVRAQERDAETVLFLRRCDLERPRGFSQLIETFIENHQRKYKLDVEDEYQSALSWYYERCYAQSATQVPFFVERHEGQDLRVQAVAMSEGNSHLARFFCTDADNYNFTPVCLPQRLEQLERQTPFVLAMYRQRGEGDQCMRIHSAADFEFSSSQGFAAYVQHALSQAEHSIVKVQVGRVPAAGVCQAKVEEASQRLQYKSEAQMGELRERLERLHFVAYMADITQEFSHAPAGHQPPEDAAEPLSAWVGTERRDLASGAVVEKLSMASHSLKPELIRFGYVERRREDRYLAETRVEVRVGGSTYQGMSRDISTRGMRIALDARVDVRPGTMIKVGLLSLQKKKAETNLMDIPYRVVNTRLEEARCILMLERILGTNKEGLKEFFVELITKNQHKLGVDIDDIWSATVSRVYEAVLATNLPSVPFFLARNSEGGAHLQFVGVPEAGNALVDFFATGQGSDFRCLNERRVVTALYDAVQILGRQAKSAVQRPTPFELELYLYKEHDELTGEVFIHSATEMDFGSVAARAAFGQRLPGYHDWRCLKVMATFIQPLDEKTLDGMTKPVRTQSKHRAIKLSELMHSLVGYGELVDITEQWSELRDIAR